MEDNVTEIRVRFAPSPTGELHIGGARTALFNYLYARRYGGTFVLRIDDTDLERSKDEYSEKLIEALKWLGLKWDEGPVYQSQRFSEYLNEVKRLVAEKKAYRCYCSVEELTAGRELARKENRAYLYPGTCRNLSPATVEMKEKEGIKPVIRLLTPDHGETIVNDLIRGEVSFDNSGLDDLIILKSNGQPTYNFASVVDDFQLKISHVIRAEEHLSNTPRQILCAQALGYAVPAFAHVSMILAPDRSKLSKRHGATSVEEFRSLGFLPEALINFMALLGWSPGAGEEGSDIFTLAQMSELFSLDKAGKTAAVYDTEKLTWMNGQYIRNYELEKLTTEARPYFVKRGLMPEEANENELSYLSRVIELVRERAKTLVELADLSFYFFEDRFPYDQKSLEKVFKKEGALSIISDLSGLLSELKTFDRFSTENLFNDYCARNDLSTGKVIQPVRLAVTGLGGGPGLFEIMELIGQEKTIKRLTRALATIPDQLP
jgi:glutamyl-tRNA synthetase